MNSSSDYTAESVIRADERERCARIAEQHAAIWRANRSTAKASAAEKVAAEIRNQQEPSHGEEAKAQADSAT